METNVRFKANIRTDPYYGNYRDLSPEPTFRPWSSHSEPLETIVWEVLLKSSSSLVL